MTEVQEIRAELDWAARLVAATSTSAWPMWVAYLLEALDKIAHRRGRTVDFEIVLNCVRQDINRRLIEGRW
jgi:hypothetical protein